MMGVTMKAKRRVLFPCTGNSCRSQMAEGLLRAEAGDLFEVCSAGIEPHGLDPLAVRVMAELDIDISSHTSEAVDVYVDEAVAVAVCDHAREICPVFPGVDQPRHWSFDDPAVATGTVEERLPVFRRVRDEIRARVRDFIAEAG